MLIRAMPAPHGLTDPGENDDAASVLLTLVIGACFVGAANSVRELVKERPIYRRERAAGLSAGIYLLSKILILGLITGIQAVLLVLIGLAFRPMPAHGAFTSPYPELMLAMAGLSVASMAMGLLVSAAVSTSEKTMPLLVLLSLAQVILCGALMPLQGKAGLEEVAWITPSRWGLGAAASTVDLARLPHKPIADRLWHPDATTWGIDMGVLAGLGLLFVVIAWWRLERLRPGRRS
jgi:ABC-type multidrug transport system permease subunit